MSVALTSLTSREFAEQARALGLRASGAAGKVYRAAICEGHYAPADAGLSEAAVGDYLRAFDVPEPEVVRVVEEDSEQGPTAKAVMRLADGLEVECVCIPMGRGKTTLCISSQVGCKMGCTFCETGRMGLLRHLRVEEIIGQLWVARHRLGWPFRNVVFMGMGEALDNADNVLQALRVMTDSAGMRLAHERITICTVGHVEGIRRLAGLGYKRLNLSVSLNAGDDELRAQLMPIARKHPLAELQAALIEYRQRDNLSYGINFCLMPGINDDRAQLDAVARFVQPLGRVLVNVIPYNPGTIALTRAPSEQEIAQFVDELRDRGLAVRRRVTKGRSVMAACGQLGNVQLRRSRPRPAR